MKQGANSSDRNNIKRLEREGHSSATISAGINIDEETVKAFMVNPDATDSFDQAIDTNEVISELQTSLVDANAKILQLEAEIEELKGEGEDPIDEGFGG